MKDIVIIHHGKCYDGFTGAWAAWRKFGDRAEYIGIKNDNKTPPEDLLNKEIYLIDFCFEEKDLKKIIAANKQVTLIDHHKTAEELAQLTQDPLFDINHSGAYLAWQYFHPEKEVPELVKYIEDHDLFRFKLPQSREIGGFLRLHKQDFELWNKLMNQLATPTGRALAIEKGSISLLYKELMVGYLLADYSDEVEFESFRALVVNAPTFLASDTGHGLVKMKPPIGIVWSQRRGKAVISLRSDGSVDVAEIAKKYGGGGHKAAAGFSLPAEQPLPWKYL